MTVEQMEAGRELDAVVAEKVMGWVADYSVPVLDHAFYDCQWEYLTFRHPDGREIEGHNLPPYSTDIAAAWEVFVWLSLQQSIPPYGLGYDWPKGWHVYEVLDDGIYTIAAAETAPLAICLAALKAVDLPA